MNGTRRRLLLAGAVTVGAGAALAAVRTSRADTGTMISKAFLLLHGSWHGSWAFERVAGYLVRAGHKVAAPDLPGHGTRARFPRTYLTRPLPAGFSTEQSPIAHLTHRDYATDVMGNIVSLAQRYGRVTVVGHSSAGMTLGRLGEEVPDFIERLVYVAGWMPASGVPPIAYLGKPEFAAQKVSRLFRADPGAVGALRIDPRSPDATYQAQAKEAFAGDLSDDEWTAVAHLLTPDDPLPLFTEPLALTAARWGRIPRTYIKCTADHAMPVPGADLFIREADAFTPDNRTSVATMSTSHSPFFANPQQLANLLVLAATPVTPSPPPLS